MHQNLENNMKKLSLLLFFIFMLSSCANQLCGKLIESGYTYDNKYYVKLIIDNDTLKLYVNYETYQNIGNFDYNLPYCINRESAINNLND